MASFLCELIGRKITEVKEIHDYIQLIFDNGAIVNIYNHFDFHPYCQSYSEFEGKVLADIEDEAEEVKFIFECGNFIRVGLRDEDFRGPEAIGYKGEDGKIVVWQ